MNLEIPIGIQRRMRRLIDEFDGSKDIELSKIYKDIDAYYAKTIAPHAACKKGCSFCCHVPVEVTQIEALHIAGETGKRLTRPRKNKPRQPDNTACPFLKDNQCSIYRVRPLACRIFASLDSATHCINGNQYHLINNVDSYRPTRWIANLLTHASKEMKGATYADIREWFKTEQSEKES